MDMHEDIVSDKLSYMFYIMMGINQEVVEMNERIRRIETLLSQQSVNKQEEDKNENA